MARSELDVVVHYPTGTVASGIEVTVYDRDTTNLVVTYAGETGATELSNPLTTDEFGRLNAWLETESVDLLCEGVTQAYESISADDVLNAGGVDTTPFEHVSNKTNDTTLAADSATLYPTEHAAKGYADGVGVAAAASLTTGLALKEDVANKDTTVTLGTSNTLYPTQNAVKTYVDTQIVNVNVSGAELSANKETGASPTDDAVKYPSSHTTFTALAAKEASANKKSTSDGALPATASASDTTFSTDKRIRTAMDVVDFNNDAELSALAGLNSGLGATLPQIPAFTNTGTATSYSRSTNTGLGAGLASDNNISTQLAVKTYVDNAITTTASAGAFLPEAYGAVGGGSSTTGTNDATALQACFDAADSAGGGTIYLSNVYATRTALTVGSNCKVVGRGIGKLAAQRYGTATGTRTSGSATVTGVTFPNTAIAAGRNVWGTGIPAYTKVGTINTGAGTFTLVDGSSNPVLATATSSTQMSFSLIANLLSNNDTTNGNSNITIDGVEFDGGGWVTNKLLRFAGGNDGASPAGFVQGKLCNHILVRDCHLYNSATAGIGFQMCQNVSIRGNEVHDNSQDGIDLFVYNRQVVIEGNRVYHCGDDQIAVNSDIAGLTGQAQYVDIVGNICGWEGGELGSGQNIAVRGGKMINITGNVCTGSYGIGILLGNGDRGHIAANASDVTVYNIPLSDVTVTGNLVENSGHYATGDNNSACGIKVSCFEQNDMGANTASIARINITGNVVNSPSLHGIVLAPFQAASPAAIAAIQDVTIANNTIAWTNLGDTWNVATARGIGFDYSSVSSTGGKVLDTVIVGNKIHNAPAAGIHVGHANTSRCAIKSNQVVSSGRGNATSWAGVTAGAADAPGISVSNALDVQVIGNESYDLNGTKHQTYGIDAQTCTGTLTIIGNNCSLSNATGNLTSRVRTDGNASFLRISNNSGYEPWRGTAATAATGWIAFSLGGGFYLDKAVTFDIPFPATPRVTATVRFTPAITRAWSAQILTASTTGFTARIWTPGTSPAAGAVNFDWIAEPQV